MSKRLLIYGAGAIGRGYVPWVFTPYDFSLSYVEADDKLHKLLRSQGRFTSYCTKGDQYVKCNVTIDRVYALGEELQDLESFDGIVTAVGPRNVFDLVDHIRSAICPIVLFENDSTLVNVLRKLTGNSRIYFGIPDVITSNTAPAELLIKDPLAIVTEDGECYIDSGAEKLGGISNYVDETELNKQWLVKLYMHNTPHCVAAYLGSLCGKTYLHEGMQNPNVFRIVEGIMMEMSKMLLYRYKLDSEFVDWYAQKELSRFSNLLLYDPIVRVAREPFRKLAPNNRLIGAAQLALFCGIVPENLIIGILAAFLYDKTYDPDFNMTYLVNALTPENFLKLIIGLNPHEALYMLILDKWESIMNDLRSLTLV